MLRPIENTMPSGEEDELAQMVTRARGGDSAAFDALFRRFNARIFGYLARMVGNDEEGRDLTQETFVKAWRMLPGLHDSARFSPWLYRIATSIAIDHLRSRKGRGLWQLDDETSERANSNAGRLQEGPEEQVAQTEQVRQALALVSPRYRACLLLQITGGFSQREIASMLHMSEKSVSVYVRRGSEQFRRAYENLEHYSTMRRDSM